MVRRPFDRPRSRVRHIGVVAQAPQDADCQVVSNLYLAGKAQVFRHLVEPPEPFDFRLCFRRGLPFYYLDSAGRAPRVSPTTVQDVDPRVLDREDQAPSVRTRRLANTFDSDNRH
jgi:hypothetical protein